MLKPSSPLRFAACLGWLLGSLMANAQGAEPEQAKSGLQPYCPKDEPVTRRRPGAVPRLRYQSASCHPGRLSSSSTEKFPELTAVNDRWRIVEALGYPVNWLDPYHGSNPLKGDRPVFGKDWFFNLNMSSISLVEPRRLPGFRSGSGHSAGSGADLSTREQFFFSQNFSIDTTIYQGDTVFRPPDFRFRFTPVINYNLTSSQGQSRDENSIAVQALYLEKHLRDVSERYDFDSIRVGIQPFSSDFRGFLLLDQQLGVRLFGTRNNNIFQYNFAWLRRLQKNSNTLNDLSKTLPDHDVFIANLYWQDFLQTGFTSQLTAAYTRNRELGSRINAKRVQRNQPASLQNNAAHDYDVVYLGYNGDGHFGRANFTGSFYYALGTESNGTFTGSKTDVSAFFTAAELSIDFDWIRLRLSGLYASGDDDPFDQNAEGFDGIFQSPVFAGADSSFFIHQSLPLIRNGVNLKRRNALFTSLRTQDDPGQANFTNPGIRLIGVGADFDLLPELRLSVQVSQLWFDQTVSIEAVSGIPQVANNIGQDFSISAIYRPFTTQNIVFRLAAATLVPGAGYRDLYDARTPYSLFANLVLSY